MRAEFPTLRDAQTFSLDIHQRMTRENPVYAKSVTDGKTTNWAIPYQDTDENGIPLSTTWFANLKERVRVVLMPAEEIVLKPYKPTSQTGIRKA